MIFFLVALCLPVAFNVGTLHLSPYRTYLLIMFLPSAIKFIRTPDLRVRPPDICVVLYTLWAIITIQLGPGPLGGIEAAGSLAVETLGAYILARAWIRDAPSFKAFAMTQLVLVAILMPFVLYEAISSRAIILEFFGKWFKVFPTVVVEERLGMRRAQGSFEHPILFGVFSSTAFGLTLYTLRPGSSLIKQLVKIAVVVLATFYSLSAGAYLTIVAQAAFAAWDRFVTFTRNRWRILIGLFVFAYVFVDLVSNRTPFHVFITYLSFNTGSSYNRILIWDFGTAEVWRNPIFGLGLFNEWERPEWMKGSIDNFWLLRTMRHGLPGLAFLLGAVIWITVKLSRLKPPSAAIDSCRRGILTTLGGLFVALVTVDLWSGLHAFFWFLLGTSVWMLDGSTAKEAAAQPATEEEEIASRAAVRRAKPKTPARPAPNRPPLLGYPD